MNVVCMENKAEALDCKDNRDTNGLAQMGLGQETSKSQGEEFTLEKMTFNRELLSGSSVK